MNVIPKGTWVEIEQIILTPDQRPLSLPEDTKKVPYVMRVSGFLDSEGEVGQEVRIRTIIGRVITGKLTTINPGYSHSFGKTIPELLKIGTEEEE
jgi:hypothetical protein